MGSFSPFKVLKRNQLVKQTSHFYLLYLLLLALKPVWTWGKGISFHERDYESQENLFLLSHRKSFHYQGIFLAAAGTKGGFVWLNRFGKHCIDQIKWVFFLQGGLGPLACDVDFEAAKWTPITQCSFKFTARVCFAGPNLYGTQFLAGVVGIKTCISQSLGAFLAWKLMSQFHLFHLFFSLNNSPLQCSLFSPLLGLMPSIIGVLLVWSPCCKITTCSWFIEWLCLKKLLQPMSGSGPLPWAMGAGQGAGLALPWEPADKGGSRLSCRRLPRSD